MTTRRLTSVAVAAVLLAFAPPASAAGGAHCSVTTTPLAFGQYVPSRDRPSDFTATLHLDCVSSGAASTTIEGTISLIGSGGKRELADGPRRLRYQLFADPARSIPWGDGSGGSPAKALSGLVGPTTPLRASFTIYGRILARQPIAQVGHYTDQITVVLNY